mmetsp:Transcript_110844/g.165980  ORF Transcript_110844/g.165980 Transcript_110844/m.165980 type:complete len:259 (-) Transcript_110844:1450-2226(-)
MHLLEPTKWYNLSLLFLNGSLGRNGFVLRGFLVSRLARAIVDFLVCGLSLFLSSQISRRRRLGHFCSSGGRDNTGEDHVDIFSTFNKRKDGNDNGSTESPGNSNQYPEGEVALGENTGRNGQQRPDDNQDESQDVSSASDPPLGTAKGNGVLLFISQSTQILFDKGDLLIESIEIEVLGVDEGRVNIVDESRTQNSNQVSGKHYFVCTKVGNRNTSTLDLSGNQPSNDGHDKSRPGSNHGSSARGLGPCHHVPQGNDS